MHIVNPNLPYTALDAAPPVNLVALLLGSGRAACWGMRRLVLGSDAEQVVRTAHVPVLLVRSAA